MNIDQGMSLHSSLSGTEYANNMILQNISKHHIREESALNSHFYEKLKSHIFPI